MVRVPFNLFIDWKLYPDFACGLANDTRARTSIDDIKFLCMPIVSSAASKTVELTGGWAWLIFKLVACWLVLSSIVVSSQSVHRLALSKICVMPCG